MSTSVGTAELVRLRPAARQLTLTRFGGGRGGLRRSRLRGRGMDYRESRDYQPGDDVRHIDWRVTARSGKPHTKLYQEERERPLWIVVDFNPSMYFATRGAFKTVVAARLAALLGWAAVDNGDRVGALLFGPDRHQEIPDAGGPRGALTLIRALVGWAGEVPPADRPAATAAPLDAALTRLRRVIRPGSLIVIVSDFYTPGDDAAEQLRRLRRHGDAVACQPVDTLEREPPPPGRYGVSDGSARQLLDVGPPRLRQRYREHFAAHHARVRTLTRSAGVPLLVFATDGDPLAELRSGLKQTR